MTAPSGDPREAPPVSLDDWTLLGAYADGELSPEEADAVRRRLRRDVPFARAFEDIRRIKRDLRRWGGAARPGGVHGRRALPALALSLVAALCGALGAATVARWSMPPEALHGPETPGIARIDPFAGMDPLGWHLALAGETGGTGPVGGSTASFEVPALDLSVAGLTLTREVLLTRPPGDAVLDGAILLRHYEGRRGCRLTHVVDPMGRLPTTADGKRQEHRWSVGGVSHALVSQGMDDARFRAVAAKAEAATRERPVPSGQLARRALRAPCLA